MKPLSSAAFSAFPTFNQAREDEWILSDGSTYVGPMVAGKPHGFGTLTDRVSDKHKSCIYKRNFKDGKKHGEGELWTEEGEFKSHLKGRWENEVSALGIITYESYHPTLKCKTYRGAFKNNQPHGVGSMTMCDGKVCDGLFEEGQLKRTSESPPAPEGWPLNNSPGDHPRLHEGELISLLRAPLKIRIKPVAAA